MKLVFTRGQRFIHLPEDERKQSIRPISCVGIQGPVQLVYGKRLGIESVENHLRSKLGLGLAQSIQDDGFPPTRLPYHHSRVAGLNDVIELHHLIHLLARFQHEFVIIRRELVDDFIVELQILSAG